MGQVSSTEAGSGSLESDFTNVAENKRKNDTNPEKSESPKKLLFPFKFQHEKLKVRSFRFRRKEEKNVTFNTDECGAPNA